MKNEIEKKERWKLRKLTVEFKKGYSFQNTEDRYEGKIEFENGDDECFTIKLTEEMSKPYLKLISKEVVKNAEKLAEKIAETFAQKIEQGLNLKIENND
jgi:hypothetical protein